MSPRHATVELLLAIRDFSGGVRSGISERGLKKINFLSGVDNLYGRPYRGLRVRPGSRDLSTAILSDKPHSLLGFYASGGNKLFVGAATTILEVTGTAYTLQTLPASHLASSDILTHTNLDGVLLVTQRGGALTPLMYDGAWKELKLPKPTLAVTFAADDAVGGGVVDVGPHYYRVRWRYAHGASLVGPVSALHTVAAPNQSVHITANLLPATPRSDFIGWTLERTKVNSDGLVGPWWFVADGNSATYNDLKPDSSLGYIADEGIHGEPPHFDGLTNFAGRLWGWHGSQLLASQATNGDLEATGIANFDPDLTYPVAMNDGDDIQVCVVVLDELLILKRRSVHVISGVDPDSFVLTSVVLADPSRGSEAGCASPRAACVIGGVAYFWGESGGLFTYSRGSVKPAGWVEVGRYLDELNVADLDDLLLINHQGNYMLAWYPRGASTLPDNQIVYDARFKQWWHWKGWVAKDAIELKAGLFSSASMATADPTNHAAFAAIALNTPISGPGIQGGSVVAVAVVAGQTSLTMSKAAIASAQNVALLIGATPVGRCNTVSGSVTVTITEYHCWAVFDSFQDEKSASGSGTPAVVTTSVTPAEVAFAYTRRAVAQNAQVYLDGLNPLGTEQFPAGGTLASVNAGAAAIEPVVIEDGSGNFIVVWNDARTDAGDIYAQKFNPTGVAQWAPGGVLVNGSAAAQARPAAISDGAGGAFIVWQDARSGINKVYAQRINSSGFTQWTSGGVLVSTAATDQRSPGLCSDGAGGIIVAWQDTALNASAQRLEPVAGAAVAGWPAAGVALGGGAGLGTITLLIADGSGGAIVVWGNQKIRKVTATATLPWAALDIGSNVSVAGCTDGAGGCYVAWPTATTVNVRRVTSAGAFAWVAVNLSGTVTSTGNVGCCYDESLGCIVVWDQNVSGGRRIQAQRVDSTGAAQWNAGAPITVASGATSYPTLACAKDGIGGAFIGWYQQTAAYDTLGQRLDGNGNKLWGAGVIFRSSAITNAVVSSYMAVAVSFTTVGPSTGATPTTGGKAVLVSMETPWLDAGLPDDWKDLDRIAFTADGDQTAVAISVATDPAGAETNIALATVGQGADWAEDAPASNPNDLEWDVGDWATDSPTTVVGGVPSGTIARRFKITASTSPTGDYRPTGLELVAVLLPDKEYSQ